MTPHEFQLPWLTTQSQQLMMSPLVRHMWPMSLAQVQGWLSPHSQIEKKMSRPDAASAFRIVRYASGAFRPSVLHQSYLR